MWFWACATPEAVDESAPAPADSAVDAREPTPATAPGHPLLKRLTAAQYANAVHDLLGEELLIPDLEPDAASAGLLVIGGTVNALSAAGVEDYETAAYDLAEQALASETGRERLLSCTEESSACTEEILAAFGRRAWRRPLEEAELARLVAVVEGASSSLGSFEAGLVYGVAAVLQSPWFVYRVELGEDDPEHAGARRYGDWEMASRLAFFLWNTTPDDELLAAAEAGELVTDAGVATQVERMLADDRARAGVRNFFDEMLELQELEELSKDPTVYVHYSSEVGASAREETLSVVEWLVFDQDADLRELFTTRTTFVDRKLAAIYGIPAPAMDGFGQTELPDDHRRRGLLGHLSFLAANAHPTATSPTRRGEFVREVLLCTDLPAAPAGLNTAVPEPSEDALTMRDRLEQHNSDPACTGCHLMTDPIGLGLENFDGLGGWRLTDNGATVDPSGDLDGAAFADAWDLGGVLHDDPDVSACLVRTVFQYANAWPVATGEAELVDWHAEGFAAAGHRMKWLLADIATGPGFRTAGEIE